MISPSLWSFHEDCESSHFQVGRRSINKEVSVLPHVKTLNCSDLLHVSKYMYVSSIQTWACYNNDIYTYIRMFARALCLRGAWEHIRMAILYEVEEEVFTWVGAVWQFSMIISCQ